MVGLGIAGREKSAAVWEPVCERRGQVRERDDKKGSKPGRMAREPEGYTTVPGTKGARGRGERGEERARRTWWGRERGERAGDAGDRVEEGKSWGSMDATPRGTTLSWILRSKPATA